MKLLLEWHGYSRVLEPNRAYILGRDQNSDLVVDDSKVSRSHLKLYFNKSVWLLEDLASTNGTFLGNKRIVNLEIKEKALISLGGKSGPEIRMTTLATTETPSFGQSLTETKILDRNDYLSATSSSDSVRIRLKSRLRIGRSPDNDWVIDDLNVSRNHAEIIRNLDGSSEIIDLNSMNGTFVNDKQVSRSELAPGDILRIGIIQRRFGPDGLELVTGTKGTHVEVENVSFEVGEKRLLDDVSFTLAPRTLTAIIGPSGAGKSTLLGVLTGRSRPSEGSVLVSGLDLSENLPILSRSVGLVPQNDIIHSRLTVRQALDYGARLRLPDDVSKSEREVLVTSVMEKLELSERANLRIDRLSGGQRKRASIGLELLTSPEVLVLDEPTSGLDPGLDAHVMGTLRTLADEGQTVVVVTHSVENLDLCDNVILMASGGRVAYFGPSSSVFSKLEKKSWSEVFRYLASVDSLKAKIEVKPNAHSKNSIGSEIPVRRKSNLVQLVTLSLRYIRVIASDKFYLTLLTLIPILVGAISYAAGSEYGFGPGASQSGLITYNPFAQGTMLVLVLGSVFVGLSTSIQEIVKENQIRMREQSVGVRAQNYLASKVVVLSLIVCAQIVVFVTIVLFGRPVAESGLLFNSSKVEIYAICILLSITSMSLGLLISSLLSSPEQAMPALVGMTMFQIVLSGTLPLEGGNLISTLSKISPSFWSTNSLAASIDMIQLSRITAVERQADWQSSLSNFLTSSSYVFGFAVMFILLSLVKLRRAK